MENEFRGLLELVEKDGKIYSRIVDPFVVNPQIAAGMCYVIYNTMIDAIPEEKQIDFHNYFLELFKEMMKTGHEYMEYYDDKHKI